MLGYHTLAFPIEEIGLCIERQHIMLLLLTTHSPGSTTESYLGYEHNAIMVTDHKTPNFLLIAKYSINFTTHASPKCITYSLSTVSILFSSSYNLLHL